MITGCFFRCTSYMEKTFQNLPKSKFLDSFSLSADPKHFSMISLNYLTFLKKRIYCIFIVNDCKWYTQCLLCFGLQIIWYCYFLVMILLLLDLGSLDKKKQPFKEKLKQFSIGRRLFVSWNWFTILLFVDVFVALMLLLLLLLFCMCKTEGC